MIRPVRPLQAVPDVPRPFTCAGAGDSAFGHRMLRLLTASVLACATAAAAELVVRDLDVSLSVLPAGFSYTLETPTLNLSGDDAFDSGTELSVGGRYALARPGDALGLVLGADLFTDAWTYGGSGNLFSTGLHASAGLGWAIIDDWTLLAEAGYRYGLSSLDLPASATSGSFSGTGSCSGYDARAALRWQVSPGMLVQLHAGWLSLSHQVSEDVIDVTLDQTGLFVGLGVCWRWSTAPPTIE